MVKRRITWRWHEPCGSRQFALRFAHRILWNLEAFIHCFGQLTREFPDIVVNNQGCEHSKFSTIEIRYVARPGDLWGRSEMEGTLLQKAICPS
jgi:hypothetical protein